LKILLVVVRATLIYSILWSVQIHAQTIPVGFPVIEDYYRRAQLLGQIDSSISFISRPFFPLYALKIDNCFDPDTTLKSNRWNNYDGFYRFGKNKIVLKLLPVTIIQQFNSDHAAGINDGIMIPARGYQTLINAGVFLKYGPLSIQLRPELVYAENKAEVKKVFDGIPYNTQVDSWYASYIWDIDLPNRFGEKSYQKVSWGQSSIRLNFGAISLGLSNENLWWGPGMYNSLLMTNNAPGFKHFTLNTVKPLRTPIGSFEGQIIAGRVDGSGFSPNKPDDWRYLNGMVISYQPRWVPGLFLGITRSFQVYRKNMGKGIKNYLPIFDLLTKKSSGGNAQDNLGQDQLASLFMRWFWIKGQGEIYFEYGREDHSWNLRDFMMEPTHSAAYIVGLRKLIPLTSNKQEYIQVNMEITQLEMDNITINRQGGSWYVHTPTISGYTHDGQVLGAGIGPGSNLQTINISWNKELKSIGLQFERFVHDNDFFHTYIKDIRTNWVDLSGAILSEWNYKNLLLNMKLEFIRSKNYKWQYAPIPSNSPDYWNKTHDVFNFHGQLGVTYRF
jgi:hypothetical protein